MPSKPYKFTTQRRARFLKLLAEGFRRGDALKQVGLTRATLQAHMERDPEFAAAVHEAEMAALEPIEDALYNAAKNGNVTAIKFVLCNRAPERWKEDPGAGSIARQPLGIVVIQVGGQEVNLGEWRRQVVEGNAQVALAPADGAGSTNGTAPPA